MTGRPLTERVVIERALGEHPCPKCGARPGNRCAMLGKSSYQSRRPHPERVSLAWRALLAEGAR